MEHDPLTVAHQLLASTAEHGFLSAATIAALCGLEEQLLLLLVERLGGQVEIPELAQTLTEPVHKELHAELREDGTYVLSIEEAGS